ncbi:24971_t:CDS:2, partial [Racocetra persica]
MSDFSSQYRVNDNGSINLPFGHAVETYINSLLLLTNCKLKKQSRLYVNQNIKADDIIELTDKGRERVAKIKQNATSDLTVWRWVLFCDGNNSCERACGRIGEYIEELFPVQLFVEETHRSQYMPVVSQSKVSRINLSLQARDHAIMAHYAHHSSGVEIALKLLAPYNNTSEIHLRHTILDQLVTTELKEQGKVLYYQRHNISVSENCPEYYYQLT